MAPLPLAMMFVELAELSEFVTELFEEAALLIGAGVLARLSVKKLLISATEGLTLFWAAF